MDFLPDISVPAARQFGLFHSRNPMEHTNPAVRIIDIGKEFQKAVLVAIEHEPFIRSREPEQESDQRILINKSGLLIQIESLGLKRESVS